MFNKRIYAPLQLIIIIAASLFCLQMDLFGQDISSGIKLIKNEKLSEAKKYFSSLLNSGSKPETYFYLGEIYFLEDKLDSAKSFYTKGIEANDEYAMNYAGLSKINVIQNDAGETEKNQEQAIELGDNENPAVYITISQAYSHPKVKKYDTAVDLVNKALDINSQYAPAYIALGKIYLEKNNGSEAIKNFENAIEIDNTNPEALTQKAKVYILINNYNAAMSLLEEAIKNNPSYSPALHELAELNYTTKDYAKAAEYYKKYMETSEVTVEKKKRYASILYLSGDYKEAINVSKEVLKAEPEYPYSIRILAYSNLKLDEIETSIQYFEKLFEAQSIEYLQSDYENYADLLQKTGNDSLAVKYLNKIVEVDSTRNDLLGEISVIYFKNRDWYGVISSLKRKNDITAQEYFDLGKAYYFVQDYPKADSAFNILATKVPDLPIAYFWQARVKTNFDPESEEGLAKPFYEQFISLAKADTSKFKAELIEAYSYLGYYFFLKEDKENSLDNWQKVYALEPTNKQALEALEHIK